MIAQPSNRVTGFAAILIVAAMLSACGSSVSKPDHDIYRNAASHQAPAADPVAERAVSVAMQQVGTPYRYGGNGPAGFDCSGLVHYSYLQAGKRVPRTTGQLWDSSTTVNRAELKAGDLLFFKVGGKMQHVGLYVGGDRFVHAPSTGKRVSVQSLQSDYYGQALLRAGRLR